MKTKTIEVKTSLSEYRIEHFNSFVDLKRIKNVKFPTPQEKLKVCSDFTGVDLMELRQFNIVSINNLFNSIAEGLGTYENRAVPTEVKFGETVYSFICQDWSEVPIGWVADVSASDFKEHPEKLAAMCYIEKGMRYGQTSSGSKVIQNPNSDRMEIFKQQFPLDRYIDLSAFFLRVLIELTNSSTVPGVKSKRKLKKLKVALNHLTGQIPSMK